jgi:hypothetical protein
MEVTGADWSVLGQPAHHAVAGAGKVHAIED